MEATLPHPLPFQAPDRPLHWLPMALPPALPIDACPTLRGSCQSHPTAGPKCPLTTLRRGREVWLGPPSCYGPPMVPAKGGPKNYKLQSSWCRSKILAVSLKYWNGPRGGGSKGGGVPPPPPMVCSCSNTSLPCPAPSPLVGHPPSCSHTDRRPSTGHQALHQVPTLICTRAEGVRIRGPWVGGARPSGAAPAEAPKALEKIFGLN